MIPKAVLKKKNSAKNIWAFAISVTERTFAALFCNSVFFLKTVVPFRHSLFLIFRRKKKREAESKRSRINSAENKPQTEWRAVIGSLAQTACPPRERAGRTSILLTFNSLFVSVHQHFPHNPAKRQTSQRRCMQKKRPCLNG